MSAYISECGWCGRTEFTQWYSRTAPRDRYGRVDRDYLDSRPVAYCSEEHRDAADAAGQGAAGGGESTRGAASSSCCHLHQAVDCCDRKDCGPCCERCPTCPTLAQARAVDSGESTRDADDTRGCPWCETERLRARVAELEQQLAAATAAPENGISPLRDGTWYGLPWAAWLARDEVHEFLQELGAAVVPVFRGVPAEKVLRNVETACGQARLLADTDRGQLTAPGPDTEAGEGRD